MLSPTALNRLLGIPLENGDVVIDADGLVRRKTTTRPANLTVPTQPVKLDFTTEEAAILFHLGRR